MLLPMETNAQLPFRITGQVGVSDPDEVRECMVSGYGLAGLEIQSRGQIFGTARAEVIAAVGESKSCLIFPGADSLPGGGMLVTGHDEFELDSKGSQFALGAGARWSVEGLDAELRVNAGVARGQRDFSATWMRVVGASAGIVMFDHLVVSLEQRWYHVPRWERVYTAQEWPGFPPESKPAGSTTLHKWQRLLGWSVGYRF
jgi:hypothetical protein